MKKKELVKRIAARTGFSLDKSSKVLKSILETISGSLSEGEEVTLRDFGAFKLAVKSPRRHYNISEHRIDTLPQRKAVKFVAYKALKDDVAHSVKESSKDIAIPVAHVENEAPATIHDISKPNRGTHVASGKKNIGRRRTNDTSEIHDNKFEYLGTVAYDRYLGESDHTQFPSLKTPQAGTKILGYYTSHQDAVIGVTEPLLKPELEKLCNKYDGLTLLNKPALPIQSRSYSYRPDFALCWKEHNLYIDIEIDEPYDLNSHNPIHYINSSDNLRDTYFTRNGWCVIRYSENQILRHRNQVLEHLDFVINWLIGESCQTYSLSEENRWTYEDALQMAESNLREKKLDVKVESSPTIEDKQPEDENAFIKPGKDILPEAPQHAPEVTMETQLNYCLTANVGYVRVTDKDGSQCILEKKTIQTGVYEGEKYLSGSNVVSPMLSSTKFKFANLLKIEPVSTLFTGNHWSKEDEKPVGDILVKAASEGCPIWISYVNSNGEFSNRFLGNICLFYHTVNPQTPFTELGVIASSEEQMKGFYLYALCSLRSEFRQFACDHRLLEVKVVNCKHSFVYGKVYQHTLATLIMEAYEFKYDFYKRVDYLLSIMPEREKNSALSKGNIANYKVIKGDFEDALKIYNSLSPDTVVFEGTDGTTAYWRTTCIDDIEMFIHDYSEKEDSTFVCDIVPSKIVENFTKIKSMLIRDGWQWRK